MTRQEFIDASVAEAPVVTFAGDQVGAFCDLFEGMGQRADWTMIRQASRIQGIKVGTPPYLDEEPRLWIGQAVGREWFMCID